MTDSRTIVTPSDGTWVTPGVSYVEPVRLSCATCGRPIARRYWKATVAGEERIFCEPDHATLYETYWLPTWGEQQQNAG